jgi:hypothetical protein
MSRTDLRLHDDDDDCKSQQRDGRRPHRTVGDMSVCGGRLESGSAVSDNTVKSPAEPPLDSYISTSHAIPIPDIPHPLLQQT